MTSESTKTLAFVAAALVLTGGAVLATWPRGEAPRDFREQGQKFFPKFADAREATELEVVTYDPDTAEADAFQVRLKDGRWVIPSHHNYPADAKDRLAKTAAGVIDLTKDFIATDQAADYAKLGVVDPLAKAAEGLKGRGKRVTLKDKSGQVLADFIIGNEVPGRPGLRYVRVPDASQTRVYGVNVNVDLSTRFADWIETNLLKVESSKLRKVTFDNHKVDPEQGTVQQGELLTIARKDAAAPWQFQGTELAPGREMNTEALNKLTQALGDLKIVGVRPKPAGLTASLKSSEGQGITLSRESRVSLQAHGFYLTRDGRLLSNQGDVIPSTDEGIVYTLRFGEVTFASGEALSAGGEAESAAAKKDGAEKGKDAAKKDDKTVESRYLFVTAEFDPALLPEPQPAPPEMADGLPTDPFQRTPKEREDAANGAKTKAERDKADYDRKVADGKKKAKELTDRFSAWYYLVPGDAFRSVVLDREALTRPKTDKPTDLPPGGNPPVLPGGFDPSALQGLSPH